MLTLGSALADPIDVTILDQTTQTTVSTNRYPFSNVSCQESDPRMATCRTHEPGGPFGSDQYAQATVSNRAQLSVAVDVGEECLGGQAVGTASVTDTVLITGGTGTGT